MFEEFVEKKIESEIDIIKKLASLSKENILKSGISEFTKNFLLVEATVNLNEEALSKNIEKANKLYFNYALRPKWTLLAYLFNNFESRPPEDIIHKLDYFPFYKFYIDSINSFLKQNAQIFITKNEIRSIIEEADKVILEKLTSDITNDKIKNFFKQIFLLKYNDEAAVNLESEVPFSFLKIFLSDKSYEDLLKKFQIVSGLRDDSSLNLKDIIKILSDKYANSEIGADLSAVSSAEKTKAKTKEDPNQITGVKEKKIIKSETKETKETEETKETKETEAQKIEDKKKTGIYSDELIKAGKNELQKIHAEEKNYTVTDFKINKLLSEKLNDKITEIVYNSDLIDKSKSFSKLESYKTWLEASGHLKEIFKKNEVDIYNKNVIEFINLLEEHFNKME